MRPFIQIIFLLSYLFSSVGFTDTSVKSTAVKDKDTVVKTKDTVVKDTTVKDAIVKDAIEQFSDQYKINPGDILNISVWKEETLQQELRVLPDGTISFPLAGDTGVVHVAGQTTEAIKATLTQKLSKYLTDPVVNVSIKSVEGNAVYILGQVKNPGHYVMFARTDVMQALSLAGGLTPFAKVNSIVILHRNKDISEAIKFEYSDLENGNPSALEKNYLLKSGDVIIVP